MTLTPGFLDAVAAMAERLPGPRRIPWPMRKNLGGVVTFNVFAEWQAFWRNFSLPYGVPEMMAQGYVRAQKLYILAWIDFDLIAAAEMTALATLDFVLQAQYLDKARARRRVIIADNAAAKKREPTEGQKKWAEEPHFSDLLKYMVNHDELKDDKLGMIRRAGGSVEALLIGERKPSLSEMRNGHTHGNPFESGFQAGLLELVRDLIEYAYRDMIAEARSVFPGRFPRR